MITDTRPKDESQLVTISKVEYKTLGEIVDELVNLIGEQEYPEERDEVIYNTKLTDKGIKTVKHLTDIKSGIRNTLDGTATKFWSLQDDGTVI